MDNFKQFNTMRSEDTWRTSDFRQSVVSMIEKENQRSGMKVVSISEKIENYAYMTAKTRKEYMDKIFKLILHVKAMSQPKQNQAGTAMQGPHQNQLGPNQSVQSQPGQVPQGSNSQNNLAPDSMNALQNLASLGTKNQIMNKIQGLMQQARWQQSQPKQNQAGTAMQGPHQNQSGPNQQVQSQPGQVPQGSNSQNNGAPDSMNALQNLASLGTENHIMNKTQALMQQARWQQSQLKQNQAGTATQGPHQNQVGSNQQVQSEPCQVPQGSKSQTDLAPDSMNAFQNLSSLVTKNQMMNKSQGQMQQQGVLGPNPGMAGSQAKIDQQGPIMSEGCPESPPALLTLNQSSQLNMQLQNKMNMGIVPNQNQMGNNMVYGAGPSSRAKSGKDNNPSHVEGVAVGSSSKMKRREKTRKQQAAMHPRKKERVGKWMPRGAHKRVQFKQQPTAAKTSYDSAVKAELCVALTCARTGHITKEVADDILVGFQRKIISEACQDPAASGPVFRDKPMYTEGVLKLWCNDQKALDWLKRNIVTLELKSNTPLVIKKQSEIPQRIKCGIFIPDSLGAWNGSHDIGCVLAYQNRWVNIREWLLLKADKQTDGWFLNVSVPEGHIPILMKAECRLTCVFGAVHIKFEGRGGKFFDTPPSKKADNNPEVMDTGAINTGAAESMHPKSSDKTACTSEPKPLVEIDLSGSSLGDKKDGILSSNSDLSVQQTTSLVIGNGEDAVNGDVPFV